MGDLAGLIERVGKASGKDRELDAELWWQFDRFAAGRVYWAAATGKPKQLPERLPAGMGRLAVEMHAPGFTSSIDAALALVAKVLPDAIAIDMRTMYEGIVGGHVWLRGPSHKYMSNIVEHGRFNSTPNNRKPLPLAILAALLDALSKGSPDV